MMAFGYVAYYFSIDICSTPSDILTERYMLNPLTRGLQIRYNIRYGRQDASEEEVVQASKAAEMHDKIMTFEGGMHPGR